MHECIWYFVPCSVSYPTRTVDQARPLESYTIKQNRMNRDEYWTIRCVSDDDPYRQGVRWYLCRVSCQVVTGGDVCHGLSSSGCAVARCMMCRRGIGEDFSKDPESNRFIDIHIHLFPIVVPYPYLFGRVAIKKKKKKDPSERDRWRDRLGLTTQIQIEGWHQGCGYRQRSPCSLNQQCKKHGLLSAHIMQPWFFPLPRTPLGEQLFIRPVSTSPTKGRNTVNRKVTRSRSS
jgi:hypothetical protein